MFDNVVKQYHSSDAIESINNILYEDKIYMVGFMQLDPVLN